MKLLQSFADSPVNDLIPNFLPLLTATWLLAVRKSYGERCNDKMSEALICQFRAATPTDTTASEVKQR